MIRALEKEARAAGAKELRIVGHGVMEGRFFNQALAKRFDFLMRKINEHTIEFVKKLD